MTDISGELLRYKTLKDSDAEALYNNYPELGRSFEDYCPTCSTDGYYVLNGEKIECDCQLQLQLNKHYLLANIGMSYQRLSWDDYKAPDREPLEIGLKYVKKAKSLVNQGTGLFFFGGYGSGKTMIASMVLKDLIKMGYTGYSVTMAKMVDMFTNGWTSSDAKREFERKIKMSQVLLLDDVGKEFKTKNHLSEATFDSVLRDRTQAGRPTFITTNETLESLGDGYGSAILSLLREQAIVIQFDNKDYRSTAGSIRLDNIALGEIRPIT